MGGEFANLVMAEVLDPDEWAPVPPNWWLASSQPTGVSVCRGRVFDDAFLSVQVAFTQLRSLLLGPIVGRSRGPDIFKT